VAPERVTRVNSVNEIKKNNGNTFQNAPVSAVKPQDRKQREIERERELLQL